MQVLYQCCCGMDVHKRFVVACLLWQGEDGKPHKELRRYRYDDGRPVAVHGLAASQRM